MPVRRVRGVRTLGSGRRLATRERLAAVDELFGGDPAGTLVIAVPEDALDPLLTVIEVAFSDAAR